MRKFLVHIFSATAATAALVVVASAQQPGRGRAAIGAAQTPPTAKASAPIDLTGYWVSVVTEDWRWRMLTPPKGDYASVPLTDEGRRVADTWNLAKDESSGLACKPYGVGGLMRMPGRLHISWQDDDTLKLEFDAGTQTRLLHFGGHMPTTGPLTWQGYSIAEWERAGQSLNLDRNGIPNGPSPRGVGGFGPGPGRGRGRGGPAPRGGSLYAVTSHFRDAYLRKNGVPYSAEANITEYFDKVGPEPNGDTIMVVRTVVDDPKYLQTPFITSTNFKLEKDGSKWNPTPCKIDPPVEPGK